ncbi:fungal protein [Schizosaccharomyces japonicus yFS275]|uniref:Fungal protein n=1 Tax=Schizosaccharomyces japonicus (strain yFS275 / FY16936) TaxID=402676 RepID=B6JZ22_SCHJY|nr:fungal protein [Schizosaccharomyces japonicus yFS275]EEB06790.1 fungal protein [Schizosaccharomyces japonicus yFS275]
MVLLPSPQSRYTRDVFDKSEMDPRLGIVRRINLRSVVHSNIPPVEEQFRPSIVPIKTFAEKIQATKPAKKKALSSRKRNRLLNDQFIKNNAFDEITLEDELCFAFLQLNSTQFHRLDSDVYLHDSQHSFQQFTMNSSKHKPHVHPPEPFLHKIRLEIKRCHLMGLVRIFDRFVCEILQTHFSESSSENIQIHSDNFEVLACPLQKVDAKFSGNNGTCCAVRLQCVSKNAEALGRYWIRNVFYYYGYKAMSVDAPSLSKRILVVFGKPFAKRPTQSFTSCLLKGSHDELMDHHHGHVHPHNLLEPASGDRLEK